MQNQFNSSKKQITAKYLLACFTICIYNLLTIITTYAQTGDGKKGIEAASAAVKGYFEVGTTLMYAIGAIMAVVGAVKVFNKWNAGEPDTSKVASAWFGSCIFLVVVVTIIKNFFGV